MHESHENKHNKKDRPLCESILVSVCVAMRCLDESVKTTPQMTRFRDAKVCNNLVTDEIDDHRKQSDYKCTIGLQNPKGKNSTLGIASAWWNRATRRTTPMTTWPPRPRAPSTQCKEYISNYRKLCTYSMNNNTSGEDKHDTNYINNKYTNTYARKLHNLWART